MATKNDITGDSISSRISTPMYRKGWDTIFLKKTAHEWLQEPEYDYVEFIMDPDGWREDNTPLDTPINRAEFERRLSLSTLYTNSKAFAKAAKDQND